MNDCIFCKIGTGEIPAQKVYEDEATIAFLDIHPNNPGHTLVIPKKHATNVFDIDESAWLDSMKTARRIAHALQKALGVEGVNINTNNGKDAGQVVFHSHIHVIPRTSQDGYTLWKGRSYEEGQAEEIASKIRSVL